MSTGLAQTKWLWFEKPRPLSHYSKYDKASQGLPEAAQLLWILRGKYDILLPHDTLPKYVRLKQLP
jgi:hypothetical protein